VQVRYSAALSETLRRVKEHRFYGPTNERDWLDDEDVIQMLRAEVERAGGQSAYARQVGLNRNNINQILIGRMPVTKGVTKALKLRRVFIRSPGEGRAS